MNLIVIIVAIIMSIFSTGVMSYIAMATPIGPWIAPTVILIVSLLLRAVALQQRSVAIACITMCASIGGILATACGFSFPTLYFLNASLFNAWLALPWYFCGTLTLLSLAACSLAFIAADVLEPSLINNASMPFPVSQLIYKMIAVQNNMAKAWQLCAGLASSALWFCILALRLFIPQVVTVVRAARYGVFSIPSIQLPLDIMPMLLAIGFIAGHIIAIPLGVGALSKIIIVDPLNNSFFAYISNNDFLLAFCSGMVVIGALLSFLDAPSFIKNSIRTLRTKTPHASAFGSVIRSLHPLLFVIVFSILASFFILYRFNALVVAYLIVGTLICVYQIVGIAAKIGLAPLGRFATFVMVPALFLFNLTAVHITFIATFVEMCCGVATDIMFGRKVAQLASISRNTIRWFQILGIVISCIAVGIIFWLLISHFGLGTEKLFVQRAQSRALLINVHGFNWSIVVLGALFGFVLKYMKVNPMLVLGGLLMPINYSLGLIIGGLLTYAVRDKEAWEPFWSGVFAGNSILELLKTIW